MKTLVHWLSICLTLGVALACWTTDGFRNFGAASERPVMPFIYGTALFCVAFEPLLLCDFFEKRVRACSYWNITLRGMLSGLAIFGVWAGLYVIGKKEKDHTILLILFGYALAVALGVLGMIIGTGKQTPATASHT